MANESAINNCKDAIIKVLSENDGDILKSDLYHQVESEGEVTEIAMAIKSLRDEGKIVVFGDGKSARIMNTADMKDTPKSSAEQVTDAIRQIAKEIVETPVGAKVMSPTLGTPIADFVKETKVDTSGDTPKLSINIEPVLPKAIPGNLSTKGTVANAAYCLFTAKTDNKYDALTLDIISTRIKFKGLRGTVNNAVDYLVKLGYVTKYRDGAKPVFYWSGKFSRPFERVGVIPKPIIEGQRSPFAPKVEILDVDYTKSISMDKESNTLKVSIEEVNPTFNPSAGFNRGDIQVSYKPEPVTNSEVVKDAMTDKIRIEPLLKGTGHNHCKDIQIGKRIPSEWEQKRLVEINSLIGESIRSIGSLTRFIETLNKEKSELQG